MNLEELKEKLKSYKNSNIIITDHAEIQALVRDISIDEVKENILNPNKLTYYEEQVSQNSNKKKYNCYFAYSKEFAHRYILILNRKIIIATIIKIERDWQRTINK